MICESCTRLQCTCHILHFQTSPPYSMLGLKTEWSRCLWSYKGLHSSTRVIRLLVEAAWKCFLYQLHWLDKCRKQRADESAFIMLPTFCYYAHPLDNALIVQVNPRGGRKGLVLTHIWPLLSVAIDLWIPTLSSGCVRGYVSPEDLRTHAHGSY